MKYVTFLSGRSSALLQRRLALTGSENWLKNAATIRESSGMTVKPTDEEAEEHCYENIAVKKAAGYFIIIPQALMKLMTMPEGVTRRHRERNGYAWAE